MTRRTNPFEEIEQLFNRMSQQFEESPWNAGSGSISVDVAEHDDEIVVTADLPGYEKEEIDLSLADQTLRIDAEHDESVEEGDETHGRYLRRERRHRSVSRSVRLPEAVDEEGTSATYTNGVLTVTLPKLGAGGDGSRQIDIS